MNTLIAVVIAYLYGSIPFSLIVGKIFYGVDIRTIGSGNVGGTNLGRSCGTKAFIAGFLLDGSKGAFAVLLANLLDVSALLMLVMVLLGHAFSIFIKFKGGKGVATAFGFVVAYQFWGAMFAIIVFLICLKITKYVSLSSIVGTFAFLVYALITKQSATFSLFILVIFLFITFAHRENLKKIKAGTENKITWM